MNTSINNSPSITSTPRWSPALATNGSCNCSAAQSRITERAGSLVRTSMQHIDDLLTTNKSSQASTWEGTAAQGYRTRLAAVSTQLQNLLPLMQRICIVAG
jgi:hypothetical protein